MMAKKPTTAPCEPIKPHDRFWVVTDPTPLSILADVLFETDLVGLQNQFRGGLDAAQDNVTLFSNHEAAVAEAHRRLALRASRP